MKDVWASLTNFSPARSFGSPNFSPPSLFAINLVGLIRIFFQPVGKMGVEYFSGNVVCWDDFTKCPEPVCKNIAFGLGWVSANGGCIVIMMV